jgi:hypothetical protein
VGDRAQYGDMGTGRMKLRIIKRKFPVQVTTAAVTTLDTYDRLKCTICGGKKERCYVCGDSICFICDPYHRENCRDAMRP